MADVVRGGYLYPCRCSRKDFAAALAPRMRPLQPATKCSEPLDDEPVYPGSCRMAGSGILQAEWNAMEEPGGFNWRFRVPDGEAVEFEDGISAHSGLWPAKILATLWSGGATAFRVISLPAWPTTLQ